MESIRSGLSALLPSPRQLLQLPFLINPLLSSPSSLIPVSDESQIQLQQQQQELLLDTCPNPTLSCSTTLPLPIDTCCLNHPSGHFLLAQFWDTQPSLGPNDSWTLHGLWPDLCAGGYDANCDSTRNVARHDLVSILDQASTSTHPGLKTYMDTFFKGLHGDDDLWMHEWNKHGTCVSTLEPRCYSTGYTTTTTTTTPASQQGSRVDLLDYFSAAASLHSTLRTFDVLASRGIVPSYTATYSLSQIQEALASAHAGLTGTVKCNARHELNEVWMHYITRGPLRNISFSEPERTAKVFLPAEIDGLVSKCPRDGIKYLPKHGGGGYDPDPKPEPPVSGPGPDPTPFKGRGFLKVRVLDDDNDDSYVQQNIDSNMFDIGSGCLIRQGTWYRHGTCATYRAKPIGPETSVAAAALAGAAEEENHSLFTLSSSAGPCAVLESDHHKYGRMGQFVCAPRLPVQSIFETGTALVQTEAGDERWNVLSWKNQTVFYAEKQPGRFEKVPVFADDDEDGNRGVRLEIYWESV